MGVDVHEKGEGEDAALLIFRRMQSFIAASALVRAKLSRPGSSAMVVMSCMV